jgi:hypothetical protein
MPESLGPGHDSLGLEEKTNSGEFLTQGFPLCQSVYQNGNGCGSQANQE